MAASSALAGRRIWLARALPFGRASTVDGACRLPGRRCDPQKDSIMMSIKALISRLLPVVATSIVAINVPLALAQDNPFDSPAPAEDKAFDSVALAQDKPFDS